MTKSSRPQSLNVVVASTNLSGGAGNAAMRLHEGLGEVGVNSEFLNRDTNDKSNRIRSLPISAKKRLVDLYAKIGKRVRLWPPYSFDRSRLFTCVPDCELFSDFRSEAGRLDVAALPKCDILNLHWVPYFLDIPTVFQHYGGKTPIVWTFHDMNVFTGGCHYDGGCGRYTNECCHCPMLQDPGAKDVASEIFRAKVQAFGALKAQDLTIVTPSQWLGREVRKSRLLSRFRCEVIPYGIDTALFHPHEDSHSEPSSKSNEEVRVLFVAAGLEAPRKGFDLLREALVKLPTSSQPIRLITVGAGEVDVEDVPNISHKSLGVIRDNQELSKIYSNADLFVIPSRQDNLPNTVLESIACGTPVVGFDIGGIGDMVIPGRTGWLANELTSHCLAKTISNATSEIAAGLRLTDSCVHLASEQFTLRRQAKSYLSLFQELLESNSP